MKKYVFIGIGGFIGANLRYVAKNINILEFSKGCFPINTLLVNVLGSFILAFFITKTFKANKINNEIRLGIGTGLLGAFTTFSTLCKETVFLIKNNMNFLACLYALLSVLIGIMAVYFGATIGNKMKEVD